ESLELAHHFAARGVRIEVLPERTPECAPAGVVAVSAIGLLGSFWEEVLRQPLSEAVFQLAEGVGAHALKGLGGAGAHGIQAVKPRREERSVKHRAVYIPPY